MKSVRMLREGGWGSGSGHMLDAQRLAFIHPSLVTLPWDSVFLPSFLLSFPCYLLSSLASWADSVSAVLALACRGRWWPAGPRNGGEGRVGGGWGKGKEAVGHLGILNEGGPDFLKLPGLA